MLTMNEYKAVGKSELERVVRGLNRRGQVECGVQRISLEGSRPLGLEIAPFRIERRGNRFLCRVEKPGDVPYHFVRVYEDGREERI